MKDIWNVLLKFLLSKTTLDEKIAEKVNSVDELDNKKEETKEKE